MNFLDLNPYLADCLWTLIKSVVIIVAALLGAAYLTTAERKVIGYIQRRLGPTQAGFRGILQPIADAIKLVRKEIIIPRLADQNLFLVAPVITVFPAILCWSIVPFSDGFVVADINAGILFLFAMSSIGIYGVLTAGWASNSKYALFGAMRAVAQVIAYEIAMGFSLVCVMMVAQSMNLKAIVLAQSGGIGHWYFIPLFPVFIVYWIAAFAETYRAPFDVAEGESEIVAGFHVEYSGLAFALFFLGEYMNMILLSLIISLCFFGGWHSPFSGQLALATAWIPPLVWLLTKTLFFTFCYLWFRATFPRFRYDQIMALGWKILIPVTVLWVILISLLINLGWIS